MPDSTGKDRERAVALQREWREAGRQFTIDGVADLMLAFAAEEAEFTLLDGTKTGCRAAELRSQISNQREEGKG